MEVTFGEHKGMPAETLMLKEPKYVKWILDQRNPTGPLLPLRNEILRLVKVFDEKPFVKACLECKEAVATRVSLYRGSPEAYWWCPSCDPYSRGAMREKLTIVEGYRDLLDHAQYACSGRVTDYRAIVKKVAELKGLPGRVGEPQAAAFFR